MDYPGQGVEFSGCSTFLQGVLSGWIIVAEGASGENYLVEWGWIW